VAAATFMTGIYRCDMITQERLKELYDYDPKTGLFTQRFNRRGTFAGRTAGSKGKNGYIKLCVDKNHLLAHRLAWLYMNGQFPPMIDHINGQRDDNRIENLRICTSHENHCNVAIAKNNTSGVKGISFSAQTQKWKPQVMCKGKRYFLGYFESLVDAEAALKELREKLHGDFARHA
jgi:hypothetical protein